jgi:hypothetical protein
VKENALTGPSLSARSASTGKRPGLWVEGYRFATQERFWIEELCALDVSRDFLLPFQGTWVGDAAQAAVARVTRALTPEARVLVDAMRGVVVSRVFGARAYDRHSAVVRTLTDAIVRRRNCE